MSDTKRPSRLCEPGVGETLEELRARIDNRKKNISIRLTAAAIVVGILILEAFFYWYGKTKEYEAFMLERETGFLASQLDGFLSGVDSALRILNERWMENKIEKEQGRAAGEGAATWEKRIGERFCSSLARSIPGLKFMDIVSLDAAIEDVRVCGDEAGRDDLMSLTGELRDKWAAGRNRGDAIRAYLVVRRLNNGKKRGWLGYLDEDVDLVVAFRLKSLYSFGVVGWPLEKVVEHLGLGRFEDGYFLLGDETSHISAWIDGHRVQRKPLYEGIWLDLAKKVHEERLKSADMKVYGYLKKSVLDEKRYEMYVWMAVVMAIYVVIMVWIILYVVGKYYEHELSFREKLLKDGVDPITGLDTLAKAREKFLDYLSGNKVCSGQAVFHAALVVDVDELRAIEREYGSLKLGDEIMKKVAQAFRSLCERYEPEDSRSEGERIPFVLARRGGDSIVAVFPCFADEEERAAQKMEKVCRCFLSAGWVQVQCGGDMRNVSVSIGAVAMPYSSRDDAESNYGGLFDDLILHADRFLDTAKGERKRCDCGIRSESSSTWYARKSLTLDPVLHEVIVRRLDILSAGSGDESAAVAERQSAHVPVQQQVY